MAKKITSRNTNKTLNLFSDGGNVSTPEKQKQTWGQQSNAQLKESFSKENLGGSISAIGGAVSTIAQAGFDNAKIADTSGIQNNIKQAQTYTVEASNNDELMNEWGKFAPMENISWRSIRGGSTLGRTANTINSTATGAATGAQIGGPIGGIVGGVIGLGSAIGGWLGGNRKAKRKANRFNKQINAANNKNLIALGDKADSLDTQNDLNLMANYSAYGGPIFNTANFGGGAIDYELSKEDLGIKAASVLSKDKITSMPNSFDSIKTFANGGTLFTDGAEWSNGINVIGNGGTHEENPMEGVPLGVDPEGVPNLVEEGEVTFNNYVFSNRLAPTKNIVSSVNLPDKYKDKSFAYIAEKLSKESEERPNDPISKRGLEDSMLKLQVAQELTKQKDNNMKNKDTRKNKFAQGDWYTTFGEKPDYMYDTYYEPYDSDKVQSTLPEVAITPTVNTNTTTSENTNENTNNNPKLSKYTWLRYAPVVGAAIGLGQNVFSKPDYSNADAILEAANNAGKFTPVDYEPIGNYLQYKPFDRNFYTNKLDAQSGATRRAIMNSSSPSRNAALLAADYNSQNQLGALARQAEEYNLAQRQAVETFNRDTNKTNSDMGLRVAMTNQSAEMQSRNSKLSGIAQAMQMRDTIDSRRAASMSANLSNLFDSIGDIGRENFTRNMILSSPANYYSIDKKGKLTYTNGYDKLSKAQKAEVKKAGEKAKKDWDKEHSKDNTNKGK